MRSCLAALDRATGLATAWNPDAGGTVRSLALAGDLMYVGGEFETMGGQPRNRLAAVGVGAATGFLSPWNPDASAMVRSLAVSGAHVCAGGDFTTVGGAFHPHVAVIGGSTAGVGDELATAGVDLLRQNAPNPFTHSTRIRFALRTPQAVTLDVFDCAGRRVASLLDGETRAAGNHDVEFRAEGLVSGVYLCRLTAGERVFSRKMLYLP